MNFENKVIECDSVEQTAAHLKQLLGKTRNVFTCSKCGYSIHKPGNKSNIEYSDE